MRFIRSCIGFLLLAAPAAFGQTSSPAPANPTPGLGWVTNGPAVFALYRDPPVDSDSAPLNSSTNHLRAGITNLIFAHFLPESLNHLIWTNLIAQTNGRSTLLWSARSHPAGWPLVPPVASWNTNCLLFGMKGHTAISPCWDREGFAGQTPITAITRRHAYTRGHSMGPDGLNPDLVGKKVWFVTAQDQIVQATVVRAIVRTAGGPVRQDYTVVLFKEDLPPSIEPLRVVAITDLAVKYPVRRPAPHPLFKTEQGGNVSADLPGFTLNTWKGGDSGSPDLLPLPGELVFYGGRSTSGPSEQMQADMDQLCRLEKLNPQRYQMNWLQLSAYPSY